MESKRSNGIVRLVGFAVALMFCGAVSAATLEEVAAKRLELEKIEIEAKIAEAQKRAVGTPAAAPATSTPPAALPPGLAAAQSFVSDEPQLVAVYGLGNELRAEILYKGAVIAISKLQRAVGPWKVQAIEQNAVTLARGKEVKTVYVAARAETDRLPGSLPTIR